MASSKVVTFDDVHVGQPTQIVEAGPLYVTSRVFAVDIVRDMIENVRNLTGGELSSYSALMNKVVAQTIEEVRDEAKADGYDGLMNLRIVSPHVVGGGAEIVIYANAYRGR